jgi:hypothetical protein
MDPGTIGRSGGSRGRVAETCSWAPRGAGVTSQTTIPQKLRWLTEIGACPENRGQFGGTFKRHWRHLKMVNVDSNGDSLPLRRPIWMCRGSGAVRNEPGPHGPDRWRNQSCSPTARSPGIQRTRRWIRGSSDQGSDEPLDRLGHNDPPPCRLLAGRLRGSQPAHHPSQSVVGAGTLLLRPRHDAFQRRRRDPGTNRQATPPSPPGFPFAPETIFSGYGSVTIRAEWENGGPLRCRAARAPPPCLPPAVAIP